MNSSGDFTMGMALPRQSVYAELMMTTRAEGSAADGARPRP